MSETPQVWPPVVRHQAKGAYLNGARVIKVYCDEGDIHPLEATGTVLGSWYVPPLGFVYFIEWDCDPGMVFFVIARKLAPLSS